MKRCFESGIVGSATGSGIDSGRSGGCRGGGAGGCGGRGVGEAFWRRALSGIVTELLQPTNCSRVGCRNEVISVNGANEAD
jgi:hypothetical protein